MGLLGAALEEMKFKRYRAAETSWRRFVGLSRSPPLVFGFAAGGLLARRHLLLCSIVVYRFELC